MGKRKSSNRSADAEFNKKVDEMLEIVQKQVENGDCKLLTLKEAADFLECSDSFLYKLKSKGLIPFHKPSGKLYFIQSELEEWVRGNKTKGGTSR